jgi:hypothetical protein
MKKLIGILIVMLIIGIFIEGINSGFVYGKVISNQDIVINKNEDLNMDAQSTTGPIIPSNYDNGLNVTHLKNKIVIEDVPIINKKLSGERNIN